MDKTNKILLLLVIVLIVVIIAIFIGKEFFGEPQFYAVYLRTGDLYFGRLTTFPKFGLKQVYLIQVNRDNAQSPLSIQKFSNVFWGPSDYLKINRNEVVWMTKLNPDGQLAQLIKTNPNLIPPPQTPGSAPPPPASGQ